MKHIFLFYFWGLSCILIHAQSIEHLEDTTKVGEWSKYYFDNDTLKAVNITLLDSALSLVLVYENDTLSKLSYYCNKKIMMVRSFNKLKLISSNFSRFCSHMSTVYSDEVYFDKFFVNNITIVLTYNLLDNSLLRILWMDNKRYKVIIYDFHKDGLRRYM